MKRSPACAPQKRSIASAQDEIVEGVGLTVCAQNRVSVGEAGSFEPLRKELPQDDPRSDREFRIGGIELLG
jgi:hypothetical protein